MRKSEEEKRNSESMSVSVGGIDTDDYFTVVDSGMKLTVFIRNAFKKEAARIKAEQSKK